MSAELYRDPLAYAAARRILLPADYYGARLMQTRAWAFSVAGLARIDQLQAVLDSLNQAIASGSSFASWQEQVRRSEINLQLPQHRLDNIFRTNLQQAYGAGRWQQMSGNLRRRPYLMYDAINDTRTRPAHLAMDGFIAHHADPVWKRWYPPCGYRCRCTIRALTEQQARDRGLHGRGAPPNVAPDAGWDYDRREGWQEALLRSIGDRRDQCNLQRFAGRSSRPLWCPPGPIRDALDEIAERLGDGEDDLLLRALRSGYRGSAVDRSREILEQRGLIPGDLPEGQAIALHLWSGDKGRGELPYERINRTMRLLGRGEPAPDWESVAPIIAGVNRALENLPIARPRILYRGIELNRLPPERREDFLASHLRRGARIQYNGFTALTTDAGVARDFASGPEGWVIVINAPRGCRDISAYCALPGEEHLAPLMSQLEIIAVSRERRVIEARIIPPAERRPIPRRRNFSTPRPSAAFLETCEMIGAYREAIASGQIEPRERDEELQAQINRVSLL